MALIPLPITVVPGGYASAGVAYTWTPGDAVNHNSFSSSGREILMVRNSGVADHGHIVRSAPDTPYNRILDINEVVSAGQFKTYQMFPSGGWAVGSVITVEPTSSDLEYVVLRVP